MLMYQSFSRITLNSQKRRLNAAWVHNNNKLIVVYDMMTGTLRILWNKNKTNTVTMISNNEDADNDIACSHNYIFFSHHLSLMWLPWPAASCLQLLVDLDISNHGVWKPSYTSKINKMRATSRNQPYQRWPTSQDQRYHVTRVCRCEPIWSGIPADDDEWRVDRKIDTKNYQFKKKKMTAPWVNSSKIGYQQKSSPATDCHPLPKKEKKQGNFVL